ncbi:hypothetical protein ABK040_003430 [Willaertia magna]
MLEKLAKENLLLICSYLFTIKENNNSKQINEDDFENAPLFTIDELLDIFPLLLLNKNLRENLFYNDYLWNKLYKIDLDIFSKSNRLFKQLNNCKDFIKNESLFELQRLENSIYFLQKICFIQSFVTVLKFSNLKNLKLQNLLTETFPNLKELIYYGQYYNSNYNKKNDEKNLNISFEFNNLQKGWKNLQKIKIYFDEKSFLNLIKEHCNTLQQITFISNEIDNKENDKRKFLIKKINEFCKVDKLQTMDLIFSFRKQIINKEEFNLYFNKSTRLEFLNYKLLKNNYFNKLCEIYISGNLEFNFENINLPFLEKIISNEGSNKILFNNLISNELKYLKFYNDIIFVNLENQLKFPNLKYLEFSKVKYDETFWINEHYNSLQKFYDCSNELDNDLKKNYIFENFINLENIMVNGSEKVKIKNCNNLKSIVITNCNKSIEIQTPIIKDYLIISGKNNNYDNLILNINYCKKIEFDGIPTQIYLDFQFLINHLDILEFNDLNGLNNLLKIIPQNISEIKLKEIRFNFDNYLPSNMESNDLINLMKRFKEINNVKYSVVHKQSTYYERDGSNLIGELFLPKYVKKFTIHDIAKCEAINFPSLEELISSGKILNQVSWDIISKTIISLDISATKFEASNSTFKKGWFLKLKKLHLSRCDKVDIELSSLPVLEDLSIVGSDKVSLIERNHHDIIKFIQVREINRLDVNLQFKAKRLREITIHTIKSTQNSIVKVDAPKCLFEYVDLEPPRIVEPPVRYESTVVVPNPHPIQPPKICLLL